jgi:site-specific recombinase XerD
LRLLALQPLDRNGTLLWFCYATAARVSEVANLRWSDLAVSGETGQVSLFGKGSKLRVVKIHSERVWNALLALRNGAPDDAPVFPSRVRKSRKDGGDTSGFMAPSQIWRIVRSAAERAGIPYNMSCHWFRHAHASHALDRGAPLSLVQATPGHSSAATTGRYLHARPGESSGKYLAV